jgi:hypothetical protein
MLPPASANHFKVSGSSYVRKAHLKMGLIYFNLMMMQKRLTNINGCVEYPPKTPEGEEASNGVKEIYTVREMPRVILTHKEHTQCERDECSEGFRHVSCAESKYLKS